MYSGKYILDGKTPIAEQNILKWAAWFETANRHVAKDKIGDSEVSTIFLGINHQFGDGPPILFETMIFGGKYDDYQKRYMTWEEAEEGHKRAVEMVQSSLKI